MEPMEKPIHGLSQSGFLRFEVALYDLDMG